jgi:hypothetical protein
LILSEGYSKFVFDNSYEFAKSNNSLPSKIQRIQLPFKPTTTANLLMGDINNDGFEDMIVDLLDNSTKSVDAVPRSILLMNDVCLDV